MAVGLIDFLLHLRFAPETAGWDSASSGHNHFLRLAVLVAFLGYGLVVSRALALRGQAERRAQADSARLRNVFRSAPAGIGVVANRVFQDVNEYFCEMTGYLQGELVGESIRMLYASQEEFDRVGGAMYDQVRLHGAATFETTWVRKEPRRSTFCFVDADRSSGLAGGGHRSGPGYHRPEAGRARVAGIAAKIDRHREVQPGGHVHVPADRRRPAPAGRRESRRRAVDGSLPGGIAGKGLRPDLAERRRAGHPGCLAEGPRSRRTLLEPGHRLPGRSVGRSLSRERLRAARRLAGGGL